MATELIVIALIFVFFVVLEIILTGFFSKAGQVKGDGAFEVLSSATLILFTQPLVLAGGAALAAVVLPFEKDVLQGGIACLIQCLGYISFIGHIIMLSIYRFGLSIEITFSTTCLCRVCGFQAP